MSPIANVWMTLLTGSFTEEKLYVVQTAAKVVERCILMTTDPATSCSTRPAAPAPPPMPPNSGAGAGSPLTPPASPWPSPAPASWARAIPTTCSPTAATGNSKKPRSLAGTRQHAPTYNNIRQGFVYERVPHITLKSIANNAEIDVIWEKWQETLEPLRAVAERLAQLRPGRSGRFPASRATRGPHRRRRRGASSRRWARRSKVGGASRVEPRVGPRLPAG